MTVEVLIATMNQTDFSLIEKMNIQSNAIVGNQCERNSIEKFNKDGNDIVFLNFNERGVGLNRNNALMRSTADICVLADDDMVFYDGYEETVKRVFAENPKIDVILFNIDENPIVRYRNSKNTKVKKHNFGRYGAARVAFRRNSVTMKAISFNLNFGGGARFSCGEDTLFLADCLRFGLKMLAVPISIAKIEEQDRQSTWFNGYTDKFFYDKGVLYYLLNPRLAYLLALYHCIRHRKTYNDVGIKKSFGLMKKGIIDAKKKRL